VSNVPQATDQFAVVEADVILQYRVRDREFDKFLGFSNDVKSRRTVIVMSERALKATVADETPRAHDV
jgi:hypothetical protein